MSTIILVLLTINMVIMLFNLLINIISKMEIEETIKGINLILKEIKNGSRTSKD